MEDNDASKELDDNSPDGFCAEGKTWTIRETPSVAPERLMWTYTDLMLKGDTVFGDISCLAIQSRSWRDGEPVPTTWTKTGLYIGQKGQKVYKYFDNGKRTLLFDFSLEKGQHFVLDDKIDLVVSSSSKVILPRASDFKERKQISLSYNGVDVDTWAEGIGSLLYGIDQLDVETVGVVKQLVRCSIENKILFDSVRE